MKPSREMFVQPKPYISAIPNVLVVKTLVDILVVDIAGKTGWPVGFIRNTCLNWIDKNLSELDAKKIIQRVRSVLEVSKP